MRRAIIVPLNPNRDAMVFDADSMAFDRDSQAVTIYGHDGKLIGIFDATDFSAIVCADIAEEDLEKVASRVFGRSLKGRQK